ncbi:hypothetical protein D5S18_29435 [Nocardia panacis]|uniref:Uncharacterized protein n=1 Tax=Nocardia panacis TaxID=2340916 RepID=A0A3A4K9E6_9NOCA|nr:hypothetical protein [Nocardia panacis]RJO69994.1 hypothetical protein D5S18_29435 [Nocardia panacis]
MTRPSALGYLRRDIAGIHQTAIEPRMRSAAGNFGYSLIKTLALSDPDTAENVLIALVSTLGVPAVLVPSVEHFEGGRPPEPLLSLVDVLVMEPKTKFDRIKFKQAAS